MTWNICALCEKMAGRVAYSGPWIEQDYDFPIHVRRVTEFTDVGGQVRTYGVCHAWLCLSRDIPRHIFGNSVQKGGLTYWSH